MLQRFSGPSHYKYVLLLLLLLLSTLSMTEFRAGKSNTFSGFSKNCACNYISLVYVYFEPCLQLLTRFVVEIRLSFFN